MASFPVAQAAGDNTTPVQVLKGVKESVNAFV